MIVVDKWFQVVGPPLRGDPPDGPRIHAKTYGSTVTACGIDAQNLDKLWGTAFDHESPVSCRACVLAPGGTAAAGRPRSWRSADADLGR